MESITELYFYKDPYGNRYTGHSVGLEDVSNTFIYDKSIDCYCGAWNNLGMYKVYIHLIPGVAIYIGQTIQSVVRRWQKGRGYKNNQAFWNAIKKYGWDNIKHIVFSNCFTKEEADEIERNLIHYFSNHEKETGLFCLNIEHNEKYSIYPK